MKKTILILSTLFLASTVSMALEDSLSNDLSVSGANLRPYSNYTVSCSSIIDNVNSGDRSNLRFFYLNGEPFQYKKKSANTLLMKTFNTSSSYFELFTNDGNSATVNYNVNKNNSKAIVNIGLCTIKP